MFACVCVRVRVQVCVHTPCPTHVSLHPPRLPHDANFSAHKQTQGPQCCCVLSPAVFFLHTELLPPPQLPPPPKHVRTTSGLASTAPAQTTKRKTQLTRKSDEHGERGWRTKFNNRALVADAGLSRRYNQAAPHSRHWLIGQSLQGVQGSGVG